MKIFVCGWPLTNFIIFEATAVLNQVCTQAQQRGRREAGADVIVTQSGLRAGGFMMWCDVLGLRGGAPAWPALTHILATTDTRRPWPPVQGSWPRQVEQGKLFNWSGQIKWWAQLLKYLKSCGVMMRFGSEIDFNTCFSKRCFLIQEC